ncbi:type II toxin-antitoxin system Phd/YefM family antitoxin [Kribbella sp. CWNU-51]
MAEVPIRMLNQETARVLARVKAGEEMEITERGVVIARLVPVDPSPLGRLLATGHLRPSRAEGAVPHPSGEVRTDHEAGELLEQMRDGERY